MADVIQTATQTLLANMHLLSEESLRILSVEIANSRRKLKRKSQALLQPVASAAAAAAAPASASAPAAFTDDELAYMLACHEKGLKFEDITTKLMLLYPSFAHSITEVRVACLRESKEWNKYRIRSEDVDFQWNEARTAAWRDGLANGKTIASIADELGIQELTLREEIVRWTNERIAEPRYKDEDKDVYKKRKDAYSKMRDAAVEGKVPTTAMRPWTAVERQQLFLSFYNKETKNYGKIANHFNLGGEFIVDDDMDLDAQEAYANEKFTSPPLRRSVPFCTAAEVRVQFEADYISLFKRATEKEEENEAAAAAASAPASASASASSMLLSE